MPDEGRNVKKISAVQVLDDGKIQTIEESAINSEKDIGQEDSIFINEQIFLSISVLLL